MTHSVERLGLCGPSELAGTMQAIAQDLGEDFDLVCMDGTGSNLEVPIHNEMVYRTDIGRCSHVILGCLTPSETGGQTIVYDGPAAARTIQAMPVDLGRTAITYRTPHYSDLAATHTVVESIHGLQTVLFRDKDNSNQVNAETLPAGITEDGMYALVTGAIRAAESYRHQWQAGDILVINNRMALHSREAYAGQRSMLRVRVMS